MHLVYSRSYWELFSVFPIMFGGDCVPAFVFSLTVGYSTLSHEMAECSDLHVASDEGVVTRRVVIPLPRTVFGTVSCLLFGKCSAVLSLKFKGSDHPTGNMYKAQQFSCPALTEHLLNSVVALGNSQICRLPNGLYVHIYDKNVVVSCSQLQLPTAYEFDPPATNVKLKSTTTINVQPYTYSNADLMLMSGESNIKVTEGMASQSQVEQYTWASDLPWDWNENVWVEQLFGCLSEAPSLSHLQVIPAFRWTPKTYLSNVATVFQNITTEPVCPFQGMTDILLVSPRTLALIHAPSLYAV